MSDVSTPANSGPQPGQDMHSVLFAQLVLNQANLALVFLGKMPHPQSGQVTQDLEAARLFIDQLEMLQAKTKGNLTPEEDALLKQQLMALRLAFVEAVDRGAPSPQAQPSPQASSPASQPGTAAPGPDEGDSRKKFSKKY